MVHSSSLQLIKLLFHEMPEVIDVPLFAVLSMQLLRNKLLATGNYEITQYITWH